MSYDIENQIFLGKAPSGEFIFAQIQDGVVKGFNGFDYIDAENTVYGHNTLSLSQWTHSVTINGHELRSEMSESEIREFEKKIDLSDIGFVGEVSYCDDCGVAIDTNEVSEYVFHECEIFCTKHIPDSYFLKFLEKPEDIFKAPNATMVDDLDKKMGHMLKLETVFCDSSGFGRDDERALSKNQTIQKVEELMHEHSEVCALITDAGQFQVYVTLYTPRRSRAA